MRFLAFSLFLLACSYGKAQGACSEPLPLMTCGTKSIVTYFAVSECATFPCAFIVGKTYNIEIELAPTTDHNELDISVFLTKGGHSTAIYNATLQEAVVKGKTSFIGYPWTYTGAGSFGMYAVRFYLKGNGIVEVCNIVEAVLIPTI